MTAPLLRPMVKPAEPVTLSDAPAPVPAMDWIEVNDQTRADTRTAARIRDELQKRRDQLNAADQRADRIAAQRSAAPLTDDSE